MSAHRLLHDLYLDAAPHRVSDPGNTKALNVDRQFAVIEIVTTGAETRSLPDPKFPGQRMLITFRTNGGNCTITAASQVNEAGDTSIVLDTAGNFVDLVGVVATASYEWRVVAAGGVADMGYLPTTGGTMDGDIIFADAINCRFNTTTGTKIGTAAAQKIGFWNATPVIQPAGAAQAACTQAANYDGGDSVAKATLYADVTELYTLVNALRTALVDAGIIKGAA